MVDSSCPDTAGFMLHLPSALEPRFEHHSFVDDGSPVLIGFLLDWGLYGALIAQVYLYYLSFPNDRLLNKWLVYGVFLIDTVQIALASHDGYVLYDIASTRGNHTEVLYDPSRFLCLLSVAVLSGTVSIIVQVFYAYRLFLLTGSKLLFAIITLLAIPHFLGAVLSNVPQLGSHDAAGNLPNAFATLWGIGGAVVDITIAGFMTYHLLRRMTGLKETQTMLMKLIMLAVETGIVTALVAVGYVLLLYLASFEKGRYWCIPPLILGNVYSNAMMVNFNRRIRFAGHSQTSTTTGSGTGVIVAFD